MATENDDADDGGTDGHDQGGSSREVFGFPDLRMSLRVHPVREALEGGIHGLHADDPNTAEDDQRPLDGTNLKIKTGTTTVEADTAGSTVMPTQLFVRAVATQD